MYLENVFFKIFLLTKSLITKKDHLQHMLKIFLNNIFNYV